MNPKTLANAPTREENSNLSGSPTFYEPLSDNFSRASANGFCPLLKRYCIANLCEWWDKNNVCCCVKKMRLI